MTEIHIKIDFRSGVPIYLQLVEQIQQEIATGKLKPGDQLPTVRQLATDLRVNWNTVARAYRILDEVGLISTQQGRGTYVWERPSEETTNRLREQALEGLTRRYLAEVARLGSTPGEVEAILQQYMVDWKSGNYPVQSDIDNQ
jgi:GntR family transcriptional regulator